MEFPAFDTFAAPFWLAFGLPAVLFVLVMALVAAPRLRPVGRFLLPVFRGLLLIGILVYLAAPSLFEVERIPGRLEIYVDASRSVGPTGREFAKTRVAEIVGRLRDASPSSQVQVIAFAGHWKTLYDDKAGSFEASALSPLADEAWLEELQPLASRPWPSIAARAARRDQGRDVQRILIGDGAFETPPGLAPILAGSTRILVPPRGADRNVRAVRLVLPEVIREEEGLIFSVVTESDSKLRVPAVVRVAGREIKRVPVTVDQGRGQIPFGGDDLKLEPGRHLVSLELEAGDDEPLDDIAYGIVRVMARSDLLYVKGRAAVGAEGRDPAPLRALRAQQRPLTAVSAAALPRDIEGLDRRRAVVLDRLAPDEVDGEQAAALAAFVDAGGGLMFMPRGGREELLAWSGHPLAKLLPLAGRPEPRPESKIPEKKPEEARKDPPKKLAKADPKKSKEKLVDAPTLIQLLLIDKSPSMREGGRLSNARKGALATARRMHPEDRIGIITYNEAAYEAVPIQPVKNLESIEIEVMRIRASGRGTDIEKALELARETLGREEAAVKSVILLSDGYAIPFNIDKVLKSLVDEGISVSTIGVGSQFDAKTLTKIAVAGRGTGPIPARSPREIPAVLVDLTSGIMKKNRTRRREDAEKVPEEDEIARPEIRVPTDAPKPPPTEPAEEEKKEETKLLRIELARGLVYTDGLPWTLVPGLQAIHSTGEKAGAWVAARAEDNRPFFAHWRIGDGYVAMLATAPEGGFVGDLPLWEGYGVFLSQVTRFLEKEPGLARFRVRGSVDEDQILLTAIDTWGRRAPSDWSFEFRDLSSRVLAVRGKRRLDDDHWLLQLDAPASGGFLTGRAVPRIPGQAEDETLEAVDFAVTVPPPLEVRRRGGDLEGLEAWSRFLNAPIVAGDADLAGLIPRDGERRSLSSIPALWLGWLLLLFLLEIAAKRYFRKVRE